MWLSEDLHNFSSSPHNFPLQSTTYVTKYQDYNYCHLIPSVSMFIPPKHRAIDTSWLDVTELTKLFHNICKYCLLYSTLTMGRRFGGTRIQRWVSQAKTTELQFAAASRWLPVWLTFNPEDGRNVTWLNFNELQGCIYPVLTENPNLQAYLKSR
jgi:hypothetical protein